MRNPSTKAKVRERSAKRRILSKGKLPLRRGEYYHLEKASGKPRGQTRELVHGSGSVLTQVWDRHQYRAYAQVARRRVAEVLGVRRRNTTFV